MKLICGLGNPGKKYLNTRHNIGFLLVDSYLGNVKWSKKFNAYFYIDNINDEKVIFVKPLTFMNNSGLSIRKIVDYYKIDLNDILIIHDELDLEFGKYKLKFGSSDAGHNGVKSIINCLNSNKFSRLKIGINDSYINAIDFVLSDFNKKEMEILKSNSDTFNDIIDMFIKFDIDKCMNTFN